MNMIEKVARNLCWANGMDPDLSLGGDKQNFLWMEYIHQARRAIEAMRDPTWHMIQAHQEYAGDDFSQHVIDGWQFMIDAALSETTDHA